MKKIIFIIISFFSTFTWSQSASYFSNTSYGLGLPNHFLSTRAMGMGDAGLATSDSINMNLQNYSLWSNIRYTQFQIGFSSEINSYSSYGESGKFQTAGFSGMSFAIPLKQRKIALFFNLLPMNHLRFNGYQPLGDSLHFERDYFLEKKGDAFQLNGGVAYRWNKYLASSVQFLYVTGTYLDQYKLLFQSEKYIDVSYKYEYNLKVFGVGISHSIIYNNIRLGGYINHYFNGTFRKLYRKSYDVTQKKSVSVSTTLPYEFGVGIALQSEKGWIFAGDFHFKNYAAGVPTFIDLDSLFEDYKKISIGVEKYSKADKFEPIMKRMSWRAGTFYGVEGYKFNGNGLPMYGISLGVGIPLNYYGSRLDLALQIGKRGSKAKNGVEETFIKFGMEFKTFERWFKRFKR